MWRIVTDIKNHRGERILEAGPWFESKSDAEYWQMLLINQGYRTRLEQPKDAALEPSEAKTGGDKELMDALASMA